MTDEQIQQTKDGYTKLANKLLEALSQVNLSAYEMRVLFCVMRKTYGWNKKFDFISVSQISELTGLRRPHACRAKCSLLGKNILVEHDGRLGLNEVCGLWNVTNIGTVPRSVTPVTDSGNETAIKGQKQRNVTNTGTVPKLVTPVTDPGNETLPIQALQKKGKTLIQKKERRNSDEFRLATLLFSEIRRRKPDFRKPNLQGWAKHVERMIRLDRRNPDRIEAIIRWCQSDSGNDDGKWRGWQDNILSTQKLREKFDKLELAMQKGSGSKTAPLVRNAKGKTPREQMLAEIEEATAHG